MDTDKKIKPAEVVMPQPLVTQQLDAGHELRFSDIEDHIKVIVTDGLAEVFGRELPLNEPVFFHQNEKFSIFCWQPSQIQISGKCEMYASEQTSMYNYINIASALNQLRLKALKEKTIGPNILVTGKPETGKSTLCKILVNYALKLGWNPVLADLDLSCNEICPPGAMAAALVQDVPLPNDNLIQSSICYFHGQTTPITLEFYDKQVQEMAQAVKQKMQNDLNQFMQDHQIEKNSPVHDDDGKPDPLRGMQEQVAPPYPELFASGTIINALTPTNKKDESSLINAIKAFDVSVVLVLDNEKLEKGIQRLLATYERKVMVIPVQKSAGVQATRGGGLDELEKMVYGSYQEYFRGKHYHAFSNPKNEQRRVEIGLDSSLRNELDPLSMPLFADKIKMFEVKGHEIPLSALKAGATETEWSTLVEEVRPQEFEKHKHKILAVVAPQDLQHVKQIESRMLQNPNDCAQLKEEFNEILLKSPIRELLQIKDFKVDLKTQKRFLEVIRTCNSQDQENPDLQGLNSHYLFVSAFNLKKLITT